MAITVASSSQASFDSSPPLVINAPSGIQVGDLLVMVIGGTSNTNAYSCSGWTSRAYDSTGGESIALYTKVAVSADTSASTYSWAVSDSEIVWGIMLRVTGWDEANETFSIASAQDADNGVFTTMDLTPAVANSLIIFGIWQYNNGGSSAVGGYAIATSNPSWTEAQEVTGAFSRGNCAVGWAVRPETTSTGDFSCTDAGFMQGVAIIIRPLSSTNYPMTASVGSFTLTGVASLLKIGKKMVATVASFVLTGVNAITSFGRKMAGVLGTFTLTGVDVDLLFGKRIVADVGTFVLTGIDAVVKSSRTMVGGATSFILTGIDSILFVGHTIVASVGTFILTGVDAVVKGARTMTASVATFTLTGVSAILTGARTMVATTASFLLTGINVAFSGARKIVADVATFTLTGIDALFPRASKIFANTGVFTLIGNIAIGLYNGSAQIWSAITKNVETFTASSKHDETWTAQDKS